MGIGRGLYDACRPEGGRCDRPAGAKPGVSGYRLGRVSEPNQAAEQGASSDDLWIFGYGSLVWRPAFEHLERHPGFITGWARRFWQASMDHRGVPEAPGRVVTLVPSEGDQCWGVVYRVAGRTAPQVLAMLDHREQGGYARHRVDVHLSGTRVEGALVYVATPDNPLFVGPESPDQIAAHVLRCQGPSGTNLEYVLRLADALRGIGADDPHVYGLERLLLGMRRSRR